MLTAKAAAIGAAGVLGAGAMGASSAKQVNQQQLDFYKEMSNTQYQRAVEDMKKAGLNPLMMYGGKGGPAPSAMPNLKNPSDHLVGVVNRMAQLAQQVATVDQLNASTAKTIQDQATQRSVEMLNYEKAKTQHALTRSADVNASLDEAKKGLYTEGYDPVLNMVQKFKGWAENWFGGSSVNSAKTAKPVYNKPQPPIELKDPKESWKPNETLRPWGQYPTSNDPDFDRKLRFFKSLQNRNH